MCGSTKLEGAMHVWFDQTVRSHTCVIQSERRTLVQNGMKAALIIGFLGLGDWQVKTISDYLKINTVPADVLELLNV